MIQLKQKKDCCGCNACTQRCPKQCINMLPDEEGFLYPHIQTDACIDCGLCEKVCPVINKGKKNTPILCFAAFNKNEEIRLKSSSGGVFTLLAESTLNKGGVVFGARFNEQWEVVHDYTETLDGLAAFRGSKYVQSQIGNTYIQAEKFLKDGRNVLYSGTPCQIAGLHNYLRRGYKNLLTIDIVCHGVPSPLVWNYYLKEQLKGLKGEKITNIEFRNKATGWKHYSFRMDYQSNHCNKNHTEFYTSNPYMKGFLADLYLRPSCHLCPAKSFSSGADITIGDFWGIQHILPQIDDNKGVCCVTINSSKGEESFENLPTEKEVCNLADIIQGNPSLINSTSIAQKREAFFQRVTEENTISVITQMTKVNISTKVKSKIKSILRKLF